MTSHGANGIHQRGRTISPITIVETLLELDLTEQHVDRMDPSKVQDKKMPYNRRTPGDSGPLLYKIAGGWKRIVAVFVERLNPANDIEKAAL